MSYATKADVKTYLSFADTFTDEDDRIDFFLETTTEEINQIIGDLLYWLKSELIELKSVIWWRDIFLRGIDVDSIQEINWNAYTWSLWEDYFVLRPQNRKVRIMDLRNYLDNNVYNNWLFEIKYNSWYNPTTYDVHWDIDSEWNIPKDLIFAQCLMVAYSINKDEWKDIVKYVMWPRTVQYSSASEMLDKAKSILSKYSQINLLP